VLPELQPDALSSLKVTIKAEQRAGIAPDPLRRFAALLPADPPLVERVAARLKLSNKARKRLALAAERELGTDPQALAYRIGITEAVDRLLLAGQADAAKSLNGWEVPRFGLGGGALIARGLTPGPVVASTLKSIEQRWVEEGFPGPDRVEQLLSEALAAQLGSRP
jgi:poly(A) polymerase